MNCESSILLETSCKIPNFAIKYPTGGILVLERPSQAQANWSMYSIGVN